MNLLEPWVFFRLLAGVVACAFFARGAMTAQKVLRHFDVARTSEGQLALEKQIELGATFVRLGTILQVAALALTALAADRLHHGIRGAMCAYGVFGANAWGFRSLALTGLVALTSGVLAQAYAFDGDVRALDLARPLSTLALAIFPLSLLDLTLAWEFLGKLDLTAVASCCSVQLDAVASSGEGFASGPRVLATGLAAAGTILSIATALAAARSPKRGRIAVAAGASLLTLPAALAASVLEVAPHVFEVPSHVCPFCLLRGDVFAIGYPLYGALFLAVTWSLGAGLCALLSRSEATRAALGAFARAKLRRGAAAWMVAVVIATLPVLRYVVVSGGASLFP